MAIAKTLRQSFKPSVYQKRIFDWVADADGNGMGEALAGSGKTTTAIQSIPYVMEYNRYANIVMAAYNKHIAGELEPRIQALGIRNTKVRTVNSLGAAILFKNLGKHELDDDKIGKLVRKYVQARSLAREERGKEISTICRLVDLVRTNLLPTRHIVVSTRSGYEIDTEYKYDPRVDNPMELEKALDDLCIHHGFEPTPFALQAVPEILRQSYALATHLESRVVDFADQLWLPWALDMYPAYQADFVIVDEAQDLSRAQLEIVTRYRQREDDKHDLGRMLFIGDRNQAIYGFAGADAASFENIVTSLSCELLPLSICYRCPTSHIDAARAIVPQIEARHNAPKGVIRYEDETDFSKIVQEYIKEADTKRKAGDAKADYPLIVCRTTAPLVSWCIRLIRNRIGAKVRGRDLAKSLVDVLETVGKRQDFSYDRLGQMLDDYRDSKVQYLMTKDGSESQIQNVRDQIETLHVCAEEMGGGRLVSMLKTIVNEPDFEFEEFAVYVRNYEEKTLQTMRDQKLSIFEQGDFSAQINKLIDAERNPRIDSVGELEQFLLNTNSLDELANSIRSLFDDSRPTVWLCTIHKAKGLESDNVFILHPELLPLVWDGQKDWQYRQEMNLKYVALTRAKSDMVIFTTEGKEKVELELVASTAAPLLIEEVDAPEVVEVIVKKDRDRVGRSSSASIVFDPDGNPIKVAAITASVEDDDDDEDWDEDDDDYDDDDYDDEDDDEDEEVWDEDDDEFDEDGLSDLDDIDRAKVVDGGTALSNLRKLLRGASPNDLDEIASDEAF